MPIAIMIVDDRFSFWPIPAKLPSSRIAFIRSMVHQDIGAPVERHFRSQGLPVYCDDPDEFVPLRAAWSFFDATAQGEDPLLGWHVGRFNEPPPWKSLLQPRVMHAQTRSYAR
jgi:hypothetical protein